MVRHFLSINDISKDELTALIDRSIELKKQFKLGQDQTDILKSKSLGMVFEKPSLRTRISFEVGMKQLGGYALMLRGNEVIGTREERGDVAHVMSRYLDLLMIRTFGHDVLTDFAKHSEIPIINGLTDLEHPCQTLADLQTIKEHFGSFDGLKIAYVGDGNNTVRSLMLACTKLGIDIQVACPLGYEPGEAYLSDYATVFHGVGEACQDANIIYTDVWASMGQEVEVHARKDIFSGYQINTSIIEEYAAENAIILHCLPAHRGEEITAKALEDHYSVILEQAENRLHSQKAIMEMLLKS